jgi:hypothetical protein
MAEGNAQYKAVRTLVETEGPVWQERLGLSHWEIEHTFLDSFFGDDGEEDFKVTAVCESRWNYLQAKIKWYLPSAVRWSEDVLRGTLVHELCHVLLSAEQSVVDTLQSLDTAEAVAAAEVASEKLELSTEMCSRALLVAHGFKSTGEPNCGLSQKDS